MGKEGIDNNTPRGYTANMKEHLKRKVLRRLKRLEGQVRGLQRMVEREDYCIDILNQSMAVKEALSRAEDLVLENHLATHVAEQMKSGKEKKAIKEVLQIYKVAKKK